MLESHGASRILASFHDIVPAWIFAGLYFSEDYLAQHPEHVRRVLKGLVKAFEFIATHETEARAFLSKYTKVKEELCMIAALREYSPIEPIERIKNQVALMVKYGYIKTSVDIGTMVDYDFIPKGLKKLGRSSAKGEKH
jgi:ABC-type nitrate/sulfonate/bicarbonate transport system substrate-binding protein